ncbi:MAG TPA: class I SAM-dependent methyltransferase [Acidimicrobiales bacterium]|nr:class I SAM-dependent methyltransferase [Acidimicrobiales bacterium]
MAQDDHVAQARAVYDAAVERYVEFVGTEVSPVTEGPVDRAVLGAFGEILAGGPRGRVADLGCGPGRVAAALARQGVDVIGIDVSRAMIEAARRAHPGIELAQGRLDGIPVRTGSLAGAVCWYSIIHTPPAGLGEVVAELGRVLVPGGRLLLGFQSGDGEAVHRAGAQGTALPLTSYRHGVDDVSRRLDAGGFQVDAVACRAPALDHETTRQAFVIATSACP